MAKWHAVAVLHVSGLQSDPSDLLASIPLIGGSIYRKGETGRRKQVHPDSGLRGTIVDADSIGALHRGLVHHLQSGSDFHAEVIKRGGHSYIDVGLMVPGDGSRGITFEPDLIRMMSEVGIGLVISAYPCSNEEAAQQADAADEVRDG